MQALRDFWARSTLNKLIVVAVVGLLCCCPLAVTGRGGRGAATAPTGAPAVAVATEAPTTAPEPTTPPAPTAPPTEAPELAGLGIAPDELRQTFSGLGFRFEDSTPVDGVPRQIGSGPAGTSLELIGDDDGLLKATLLAGVPNGDEETQGQIGTYLGLVVNVVAPEHQQEITDWVVEQLRATLAGESVAGETLETGDYVSTVTTIPANDGVVLTYSIAPR